MGDLSDAVQFLRQILGIAEKLVKQDPRDSNWQRELAVNYNTSGTS
jgi:hypothetical protein